MKLIDFHTHPVLKPFAKNLCTNSISEFLKTSGVPDSSTVPLSSMTMCSPIENAANKSWETTTVVDPV